MLLGEIVHGLVKFCLPPVPHLQPGAVLGDPKVEIGLRASGKAVQDPGGADALYHGEIYRFVPIVGGLGEGWIVP